jgi:ATP-dependent Clp protease ATP-binding subunit ClpC
MEMYMFERLTDSARRVLVLAHNEVLGVRYAGSEHLLLALLVEGSSVASRTLTALDIDEADVRDAISDLAVPPPEELDGQVPFTDNLKLLIPFAAAEADMRNHNYIGPEHLLLGMLRLPDSATALLVLHLLEVDVAEVRAGVDFLLTSFDGPAKAPTGEEPAPDKPSKALFSKKRTSALSNFGRDLTAAARDGVLDPVIGREAEVSRIIQVLSRRTKNNPMLIGEPGVGKTAVVEGLAQSIVSGDVPENLCGKTVFTLDLGSVVAGTRHRGDFEERMKKIIDEATAREDLILFIDEIHTLVGGGAASGSIDAANMLKPALARGAFTVIGATTNDEFRKHIERDAALERRFQPVRIGEPSTDVAVQILTGLRDRYNEFHDVVFTDDALLAAVTLAARYLPDRNLPDSAIDLIDEAGALSRIRLMTSKKPFDADNPTELRSRLITPSDIAAVLESWTGIPAGQMTQEQSSRLLDMEECLHGRVVGQDEAVSAVSRAVRRTRAGLGDPRRPTGSFLFLGPSGVGKTETAKALAEFLFGSEDDLIVLDMSEYMEAHTVSRLLGAPPGYVGHEEGGQLVEAVRRKPHCVVLFDEVEKAHPRVFDTLLQVLEEGRLTDSQGRQVDFANTVIVMTSNLGADAIRKPAVGFSVNAPKQKHEVMTTAVHQALKKHFRPEFLNRIDDVVVFHTLALDSVVQIVDLILRHTVDALAERGITLVMSPAAKRYLATVGYDENLGARPLRRAIQSQVQDVLAELLLSGSCPPGSEVFIDVNATGDGLVLAQVAEPSEVVVTG